ncbi:HlyD family secretion protein [Gemmatimonas groenlandica]|uniref:HlyD family efflux transporter periplasmic adaptor subunit n=1 Tax=Gemmatimonas groenlandica TaxID=2732249 RepID=A0A6M4IW39_9BACT|nr:HlyD family efflux transporter periplasmic adaptor subunit [Gemmatimonas groenlandica]QJR36411.1 HlyD family efflux transporter periplasmic adaptor subunit [Gemmatimonas groenlandica]
MIVRTFPLVALGPLLILGGCSRSSAPETAVGTLEMVEVDVGPLQPARALRVLVQEGDVVKAGDTLVLFTTPTLASSTAQAEARAVAAQEASRELASGARPAEISRAQAELRAAEADADRAAADLARLEPLAAKGDVSRASLDGVRAASRVAAGRRDAAREALRLIQDGARTERRKAAAAEARGAQAAADGWRATANDLVLIAPVAGVVSSRNVEPGEVLAAGQSAITVAQPSRPWARIYVSQFVLPTLHPGDSLSARLDGDTTLFRGRISAIATRAEFTPRVALTDQERADLLFGVKVEFADSTQRLRAGMPISVLLPRTSK